MNPNQFKFYISQIVDKWYNSEYINLDYDADESAVLSDTFYCTGCHQRKNSNLLSTSKKNKRCISCQRLRLERTKND